MTEHTSTSSRKALLSAILALVLAVGLMVPVSTAQAVPTAAEKQAEADAALEQLNSMQEELDRASDNYFVAESERAEAQQKVEEAQARIDEETAKIKEYQSQLGTRARSMYRTGTTTFLDVLLGSSSFEEFATNFAMLNTLNEKDAELVQNTKQSRQAVEEAKAEYEQQEAVAADKAAEAKRIKDEAESTTAEMRQVYDSLSAEAAELLAQEEAAREAAAAAAAAAAAEAAAAEAQRYQESGGSSDSGSDEGYSAPPSAIENNTKPQTVTGNVVVDRAYSQLGKPYSWGAVGPNSFDCSGLVSYALSGSYTRLGTTGTFMGWTRVSNPQPGDICVNSHHCGVYIGGGQMIHAPRTGDVVKVSGVHSDMIYVRY